VRDLTPLILIGLAAAVVATVAARWTVVPLLVAAWPVYVLGLRWDWWGNGVGDGWERALAVGTLSAAAGAVAGVLLGKTLRRYRAARPRVSRVA
jgi:hypothetical protein